MGQRPIGVRIKAASGENTGHENVVVSVGEAARLLGVSERTVFRLLKTGVLERVDVPQTKRTVCLNDSCMSDIKADISGKTRLQNSDQRSTSNSNDSHNVGNDGIERIKTLVEQVQEKDAQIAQLLQTQQEMTQTYTRLQEQMYELAHLVLSHNAAAAQAKAEAELRAHARESTSSRRGLTGLLGTRKRAQR